MERLFKNRFRKVRNQESYYIYSGCHKIVTIHYGDKLDYLKFEDGFQISIDELKEIIKLCEKETPIVRIRRNMNKLRGLF